jgi:hypothetical protein
MLKFLGHTAFALQSFISMLIDKGDGKIYYSGTPALIYTVIFDDTMLSYPQGSQDGVISKEDVDPLYFHILIAVIFLGIMYFYQPPALESVQPVSKTIEIVPNLNVLPDTLSHSDTLIYQSLKPFYKYNLDYNHFNTIIVPEYNNYFRGSFGFLQLSEIFNNYMSSHPKDAYCYALHNIFTEDLAKLENYRAMAYLKYFILDVINSGSVDMYKQLLASEGIDIDSPYFDRITMSDFWGNKLAKHLNFLP